MGISVGMDDRRCDGDAEGIPECCVADVSIFIVLEEDCITIL